MYIGSNQPAPEITGAPAVHSELARCIREALLHHAGELAHTCHAAAILIYTDPDLGDAVDRSPGGPRVIHVVRQRPDQCPPDDAQTSRLCIPGVPLTRIGQVKIAVFVALSRKLVKPGDVVVCVSGPPGTGMLDTIIVTQVGRELETLGLSSNDGQCLLRDIRPEVLDQVLGLASELGSEGREGRAVGTMFVVGDSERVLPLSVELILNPFHGYREEQRHILDPRLEETIKELSTLDGAMIVRGDGVMLAAGAMLKTPTTENHGLPQGLGARHHAAAGITAVTDALAIVVSQSTGSVTIFRGGRVIAEIEKPRSNPRPRWV